LFPHAQGETVDRVIAIDMPAVKFDKRKAYATATCHAEKAPFLLATSVGSEYAYVQLASCTTLGDVLEHACEAPFLLLRNCSRLFVSRCLANGMARVLNGVRTIIIINQSLS
jgi:hypothetical protein